MSDEKQPRNPPRKPQQTAWRVIERIALVTFALAAAVLLYLSRGQKAGAAIKATLNLRGPRLEQTPAQTASDAEPPQRSCPQYVLERAKNRTSTEDFTECLRRHGKNLDEGVPDSYLREAEQARGKERLNLLAEHVLDVWLWTLAQQEGTPCKPMIVLLQCAMDSHCSGLGDRVKGLQTAFWMAVMTNSIFVHDIRAPAPLEEFFLPIRDEVNFWDYRGCFAKRLRRTHYRPDNPVTGNLSLMEDFHVNREWKDMDYVHVRSNLGHVAHVLKMRHYQDSLDRLQMRHHPLSDFLYIANRIYLSQPSPRLQALAQPLLDDMMEPGPATLKVGVHVRIGDSKIANALKKMDRRYPLGATICWVRQVQQQCRAVLPRPCSCFIATDSDEVRKLFTANMTALGIPTVAAPGESFHIDWINATDDREALIEVARKSYLDWYMLTQMDGLTLSTGGYGISAAYSTLADTITYMYRVRPSRNGDQLQQCVFDDYHNRCVAGNCPGQITDSFPEWYRDAWTLGNLSEPYR